MLLSYLKDQTYCAEDAAVDLECSFLLLLFGYYWTVPEGVEEVVASLQGLLVHTGAGDE